MARAPHTIDGRRRRQTVRRTKRKYRKGALDAKRASARRKLQIQWSICLRTTLTMALCAVGLTALCQSSVGDDDDVVGTAKTACGGYALITRMLFAIYLHRSGAFQQLDMALYDIPFEEQEEQMHVKPETYRTIDSLEDDRVARDITRFTKEELHLLYDCFGLPDVVRMNAWWCAAQYVFGGEELFLFSMAKIALGQPNVYLCDHIFGGEPDRWSYGYPWFLHHLNYRFDGVLGLRGIRRFRDHFEDFASAIENAMKVASAYTDPETGRRRVLPGVEFAPGDFNFIGFIDCSIFGSFTPGTGPVGDWVDAPRRFNCDDIQRSVYTRFKKVHGLKVLSVLLPNGISFIYGPGSARRDDNHLTLMSQIHNLMVQLNNELQQVQGNAGRIYKILSDAGFARQPCIDHPYPSNTPIDYLMNFRLRAQRITIEWSYGKLSNLFRICLTFDNWKLYKRVPYAYEQLRVSFLLLNCYVCLHGSELTGLGKFGMEAPDIRNYLGTH